MVFKLDPLGYSKKIILVYLKALTVRSKHKNLVDVIWLSH